MSHSKRNTSRPVFTSHERALAKSNWASSSARLSRDSFLPFGSCGLCLGIARDPVACQRGDIFCRECALANILSQKKELKRAGNARRHAHHEAQRSRAVQDDEDRERAIRDFEMTQAGLSAVANRAAPAPDAPDAPAPEEPAAAAVAGSKRKFALDEHELSRIAREDKAKARKAIEDEKAAKPTLPSFWTPSRTPDVKDSHLPVASRKTKATPICPSSSDDNQHPISMHKLVTVHFNQVAEPSTHDKRRTCPSCLKTLSNSSNPVMAEQCGHVFCRNCVDKLLIPSGSKSAPDSGTPLMCYVCDTPIAAKSSTKTGSDASLPPGLVSLRSEGTGFSARGSSTVEKSGVVFQC